MKISADDINGDIKTRQLTLRIPVRLLEQTKRLAKRRHTTVNALLKGLLEDSARAERELELAHAYELLAEDVADTDVEPAVDAQAEVIKRG